LPPLLIATTNLGKLGELKILLAGRGLELTDLRQVDLDLAVVEDGPDYDSIARRKATLYAAASGLWTIADDTGLEVDALGGAAAVALGGGAGRSARVRAGDGPATFVEGGNLWGLLSLIDTPLRMSDLVFLGHVDPRSLVGGAEGAGIGVVLVYVAVVAGSLGYLLYRYRSVE